MRLMCLPVAMSDAGSETFALPHHGIGHSARPRVLAQRLASFSPQAARGVDPLRVARAGELDLAALRPQPVKEGAAPLLASLPPGARSESGREVGPADQPAPVPAEVAPLPAPPDGMAGLPHRAEGPAEAMLWPSPPQGAAAATLEVFALADPASAPPRIAAPTPELQVSSPAGPGGTLAMPGLPALPAVAQLLPVAQIAANPVAPAALSLPREERAIAEPQSPRPTRVDPSAAAPSPPASAAPVPADDLPPSPTRAGGKIPTDTEAVPPLVVSRSAALPATPMGPPAAPAGAPRLPPEAPAPGVLERLAEVTRKRDDEALVRIGSVSVVMRPAASMSLPPPMPALAPPVAAPMRSAHRNPWLGRGRGGE